MARKKTLFFYEMKTMKWFLLAGVLAAFAFTVVLNNIVSRMGIYATTPDILSIPDTDGRIFSFSVCQCLEKTGIFAVLALAIMSVMQFKDIHSKKTSEYLLSLPFTKSERTVMKMIVGAGILTLTVLLTAAGVLFVRSIKMDDILRAVAGNPYWKYLLGQETAGHIAFLMFELWLVLISVYSIMILVHTMLSRGVISGIIGACITASPLWLWYVASELHRFSVLSSGNMSDNPMRWNAAGRYFGTFLGMNYSELTVIEGANRDIEDIYIADYPNLIWITAACLAVTLIAVAVSLVLMKKRDAARENVPVQNKFSGIFLAAGMSVCFATQIASDAMLFSHSYQQPRIFCTVSILLAPVLFFICMKILRRHK